MQMVIDLAIDIHVVINFPLNSPVQQTNVIRGIWRNLNIADNPKACGKAVAGPAWTSPLKHSVPQG